MSDEFRLLLENVLVDFKKKEINICTRAKILDLAMDELKLSQRELAKKIGLPYSTIQYWCMFSKLKKVEYERLKERGLSETDIYKTLRKNRTDYLDIDNVTKTNFGDTTGQTKIGDFSS